MYTNLFLEIVHFKGNKSTKATVGNTTLTIQICRPKVNNNWDFVWSDNKKGGKGTNHWCNRTQFYFSWSSFNAQTELLKTFRLGWLFKTSAFSDQNTVYVWMKEQSEGKKQGSLQMLPPGVCRQNSCSVCSQLIVKCRLPQVNRSRWC